MHTNHFGLTYQQYLWPCFKRVLQKLFSIYILALYILAPVIASSDIGAHQLAFLLEHLRGAALRCVRDALTTASGTNSQSYTVAREALKRKYMPVPVVVVPVPVPAAVAAEPSASYQARGKIMRQFNN